MKNYNANIVKLNPTTAQSEEVFSLSSLRGREVRGEEADFIECLGKQAATPLALFRSGEKGKTQLSEGI